MARVLLLCPRRYEDERGWLSETYSTRAALAAGIADTFVQDNHSLSREAGTMRGLHFQVPPNAQAKLVRCIRGRVMDYAIDIRRGSPTFGRWVSAELTAANGRQLYIPVGFAHAFLTLEPDCEVAYKVSGHYAPESDRGIRFDDPDIAIAWPLPADRMVMSPRDAALPTLASFESPFPYDGESLAPFDNA